LPPSPQREVFTVASAQPLEEPRVQPIFGEPELFGIGDIAAPLEKGPNFVKRAALDLQTAADEIGEKLLRRPRPLPRYSQDTTFTVIGARVDSPIMSKPTTALTNVSATR
jgi:hypothetical protein